MYKLLVKNTVYLHPYPGLGVDADISRRSRDRCVEGKRGSALLHDGCMVMKSRDDAEALKITCRRLAGLWGSEEPTHQLCKPHRVTVR